MCNELAQHLLLCALAPPLLPPSPPLWVPLCAHISFQTGSSARHKEALSNLSKPGMRHKNVTREQRIQFFFFAGSETVSTQLNSSETNPCNQWFLSQSAQLAFSFVNSKIISEFEFFSQFIVKMVSTLVSRGKMLSQSKCFLHAWPLNKSRGNDAQSQSQVSLTENGVHHVLLLLLVHPQLEVSPAF